MAFELAAGSVQGPKAGKGGRKIEFVSRCRMVLSKIVGK
jgi:hypothetical protein